MNSASLCSLAGRYENPIPPRCLAPIDFLKIPALVSISRSQFLVRINSVVELILGRGGERRIDSLETIPEPVFLNLLRDSGIDSQPGGPVQQPYLSYRPAMQHRLAESNPRNRFLVSLNVYKYGLWVS
jgi:hypothetical protein